MDELVYVLIDGGKGGPGIWQFSRDLQLSEWHITLPAGEGTIGDFAVHGGELFIVDSYCAVTVCDETGVRDRIDLAAPRRSLWAHSIAVSSKGMPYIASYFEGFELMKINRATNDRSFYLKTITGYTEEFILAIDGGRVCCDRNDRVWYARMIAPLRLTLLDEDGEETARYAAQGHIELYPFKDRAGRVSAGWNPAVNDLTYSGGLDRIVTLNSRDSSLTFVDMDCNPRGNGVLALPRLAEPVSIAAGEGSELFVLYREGYELKLASVLCA